MTDRWNLRLIVWTAILTLANVLADVVVGSPMMVLPQLLEHFATDQAAWLNASAMLAGAIWSPLLAKAADNVGKRRVLVGTLLLSGLGAVICLLAPNLGVFLAGRFLQGAAFAAVFLTVALTVQIASTPTAMAMVGILTSGASIVGIVEPFAMQPVIETFGYRSVFIVAVLLSVTAALLVRTCIPESPIHATGRVDILGALLLGGGLGAVLAYASLGRTNGWLDAGMVAVLAAGLTALALWTMRSLRVAQPLIDLRALRRPVLLTLLALALAAGAFRSMLQLTSLVAQVPRELGLGYGLGGGEAIAVLLAGPNLGIVLGGIGAGWLAARFGPALPLLGGIVVGATASFAMIVGISALPLAIVCGVMLGTAAGAIAASGYNLATSAEAPERQGTTAGLVSVVLAVGSVVVNVGGGELLKASRVPGVLADGAPVSSVTGVQVYIAMAGVLFVLAAVPALLLRAAASVGSSGEQEPVTPTVRQPVAGQHASAADRAVAQAALPRRPRR